jgi:CheY-like chemotaxis protein
MENKKKLLFLDDDKARHKYMLYNFQDTDNTYVFTFDECTKALQDNERFDIVMLDHDLNDYEHQSVTNTGLYTVGGEELTGFDVAKWITTHLPADKWPDTIIVHSVNPVGAKRMVDHLKGFGINTKQVPFIMSQRMGWYGTGDEDG